MTNHNNHSIHVVVYCYTNIQGITFPSQVGLPMSGQTGAQYVMMETHYNNEASSAGISSLII